MSDPTEPDIPSPPTTPPVAPPPVAPPQEPTAPPPDVTVPQAPYTPAPAPAPARPPRPRPGIGLTGPSWIRPAYYYVACLLGIVLGAWGALNTAQGVVHLVAPDLGQQSDPITRLAAVGIDLIDAGVGVAADEVDDDDTEDALETTEEVLDETRSELRSRARKAALDELLFGLILLGIGFGLYRYHWLRVEPETEPARAGPDGG